MYNIRSAFLLLQSLLSLVVWLDSNEVCFCGLFSWFIWMCYGVFFIVISCCHDLVLASFQNCDCGGWTQPLAYKGITETANTFHVLNVYCNYVI